MIPDQFLDTKKRVKYDYFIDPMSGFIRNDWVQKFADQIGRPDLRDGETQPSRNDDTKIFMLALSETFPNSIDTKLGQDVLGISLFDEITDWMSQNIHHGWQVWTSRDQTLSFLFESHVDAINFKMAWG